MNVAVNDKDINDNVELADPHVKSASGTVTTVSRKIPINTIEKYSLNLFEKISLL